MDSGEFLLGRGAGWSCGAEAVTECPPGEPASTGETSDSSVAESARDQVIAAFRDVLAAYQPAETPAAQAKATSELGKKPPIAAV